MKWWAACGCVAFVLSTLASCDPPKDVSRGGEIDRRVVDRVPAPHGDPAQTPSPPAAAPPSTAPAVAPALPETNQSRATQPADVDWPSFKTGVVRHLRRAYAPTFENILEGAINAVMALFVGVIGAYAYLFGVWAGLIDRGSRLDVMFYLHSGNWFQRCGKWCLFVLCGGLVAAVFQMGQPTTFGPIQAFVLGVTWFAVVSRSATNSSNIGNKPIEELRAKRGDPVAGASPAEIPIRAENG